jgi:hypothetical protein
MQSVLVTTRIAGERCLAHFAVMRDKLLQLLHRSERSVGETILRIERQRAIVSSLDERAPDADVARGLLRQFETNLGLFLDHRDQLLQMVEEA